MSVIQLAEELIACPSITPDDAGCQAIIQKRLSHHGFVCESMRFAEVDNLWARYGQERPLIVFAGHTDVVAPGPESDWTTPPFQPTIHEGLLYGRGAADMKGSLAAMIVAAEEFIQEHPQFKGSLAFLITSDEEGRALNGTKKVMETLISRNIAIDYCVVGEASSEKNLGDQIRVGRRGSLTGKLKIKGKQGHVAFPELAKNPIHASLAGLHSLTQIVWDNGNQAFPPTSFQISNIHSGTGASNVIPGYLEVLFNLRFSTEKTTRELQHLVEETLKSAGLAYMIDWVLGAEPFLSRHGRLINATQQVIKEVTGRTAKLSTGGGTSDGRFIAPTGAELIELGVCHASVHQIDENTNIDDLLVLKTIYKKLLGCLLDQ